MKKLGLSSIIIALCIVGLVAFATYWCKTPWALLGLLFLQIITKTTSYKTVCPKCSFVFKAVKATKKNEDSLLDDFGVNAVFIAIFICVAVGVAIYYFHTAWALLGLLFLQVINKTTIFPTTCPKCNKKFQAMPHKEDDDDE
jgi:hypothetical protein